MDIKQRGERVRLARINKNMTQATLAKELQLSAPFVSNIEQGKQTMNILTLCAICDALDVSADWILRDSTPAARRIADSELEQLLADCTPREKRAIINIAKEIKKFMRDRDD